MPQTYEFEAIGTHWSITAELPIGPIWSPLRLKIEDQIERFDKTYSRFRADSVVTQISQRPGEYRMPPDFGPMIELYHELYMQTSGAMTPLVGNVLSDAGYDAKYSLIAGALTVPPKWEDVLSYSEPVLTTRLPVILDFGAAGKGYLVDMVAKLIENAGCLDYVVNAGGDIRHRSSNAPALRVALENPASTDEAIGVANLANASLCGSAGNRRAWGKFNHIIDPRTLSSPTDTLAVWVMASTTLLADALTTALYFAPAEQLRKFNQFEFARLHSDGRVETSRGFKAEFFHS